MDVLTISLGRNILKSGSRERIRMQGYAEHLQTLHIIVLTRKSHGFGSEVHEKNLHLYPTNSSCRLMMLVRAFFIGRKIIREAKSSSFVVSAQDPLEIGWCCWLLSRFRNTYLHIQVHGDYFSSPAWVGGSYIRYIRRVLARILLRSVPAIRVVSLRIKQSLVAQGIPTERITVLPIRPELESFLEAPCVARGSTPLTFLSLGRLSPEKDIPRIVRAFEVLHKTYPEARLRIVGEGSERSVIETLIASQASAASIELVSWTDNVPKEMSNADVFLLASKHEAYALTLIEAMATGLPIVTTDVGCVGEVVKDRVHGIVVAEESDIAYAKGMEEMYANTVFRKSCGEQGKITAEKIGAVSMNDYAHSWAKSISMSAHGEV